MSTLSETQIKDYIESLKGSTFIKIENYYSGTTGEVQDAVVNINVSYENSKAKDLLYLQNVDINDYVNRTGIEFNLLTQAKDELINSLIKVYKVMSNAQTNAYTHYSSAIKKHNDTGNIFIFGTSLSKKTIIEGDTKPDTRKPLTRAKDVFRSELSTGKYRLYKVSNIQLLKRGNVFIENI
jgi:hypothetical protein